MWKFPGKCGNSQENVEIPKKMWKFSEEFKKKPVFSWKIPGKCRNFQENVEIPRKMWKFPEKFSKKQVFLGNSQKNVEIP